MDSALNHWSSGDTRISLSASLSSQEKSAPKAKSKEDEFFARYGGLQTENKVVTEKTVDNVLASLSDSKTCENMKETTENTKDNDDDWPDMGEISSKEEVTPRKPQPSNIQSEGVKGPSVVFLSNNSSSPANKTSSILAKKKKGRPMP